VDRDRRGEAALRGALTLPAPLVLIGLDAVDPSLVTEGIAAGALPALAALRDRGAWGPVTGARALGDDGAWCSFATGVGPGRHGRRYHRRYEPGTYDWVTAPVPAISGPSFWGALAEQGKRFAVFDVPKSPVGDAPGNVIVADWLAHHAHTTRAVVRAEALDAAIAARLPCDGDRRPFWDCREFSPGSPDAASFVTTLRARSAARTRAFVDVVEHADFDAAIIAIGEAHCAGHQAWHDQSVMLDAYRDADAQVGEIVTAVGPDAVVIVFSLLGMASSHDGTLLLDAILRRLDPAAATRPSGVTSSVRRAHEWARANVPARVRRSVPRSARRVAGELLTRDLSRRTFWVVPTDLAATAVRCNVVGREPRGTVEPGAEFERVCRVVGDALCELRQPDTGALLVDEVLRADEVAPGPAFQDLADLHVVWNDTGPLVAAASSRVGEVRVDAAPERPGNHVAGGWFMAAGPGIARGKVDAAVSTLDFAPTVARLVGGRFDCDGVPIDCCRTAELRMTAGRDQSEA